MFLDDEVLVQMRTERSATQPDMRRSESPQPYPLPMPAYGGYFAPLNNLLPEEMPATQGFHRLVFEPLENSVIMYKTF